MDGLTSRSKLPENVELWRGTNDAEDLFGKRGSMVGHEFVDHGWMSTSTDRNKAAEFATDREGSAHIRILAPKGTPGIVPRAYVNSEGAKNEKEVLLHRGLPYHIESDEMENGQRVVTLRVKNPGSGSKSLVNSTKTTVSSKPVDQNEHTEAGKEYQRLRKDIQDTLYRMGHNRQTPEQNRADQARMADNRQRMDALWSKMTHRDVAESVMRMDRSANPAIYDSMRDELTKHVAFTNKSEAWKKATVDLGKIEDQHKSKLKGKATSGVTIQGEHVVIADDLVGHNSFGRGNVKNNDFRNNWHSTGTFGPDDVGGHRAVLAHEVGHVLHHKTMKGAQLPDSHGAHQSVYGGTNDQEAAAEAYAAAFARAHGHRYSNDRLADVGDHLAKESSKAKVRWYNP